MRELPLRTAGLLLLPLFAAAPVWAQARPDPAQRLADLGISLPAVSAPIANYVPWVFSGSQLWLAGHIPAVTGRLGADLTIDDGYAAARETCVRLIATMNAALEGDLSRVRRIIRVTGFVQATPEFTDHPRVVNGCSDLLVEVFGDAGRHSRAALGVASLPAGRAVELDLVAEVEPPR